MRVKTIVLTAVLTMAPSLLHAQFDFKVEGRDLQIHSFASQGFTYSQGNNFLTMKTDQGSFALTDMGINASLRVTDKFRVGAQVYDRNIGKLGDWRPQLDWAVADYRFKDWFGIRGGKVKTVLGLYNDTQDADFLHTWAMLPQSTYPLDLRSTYTAHTGGDIYGQIPLRRLGNLSYTGYYGMVPYDKQGGFFYNLTDAGLPPTSYTATTAGYDLRWNTNVPGLMVGFSWVSVDSDVKGSYLRYHTTYESQTDPDHVSIAYADFSHDKWHLAGEYRHSKSISDFTLFGKTSPSNSSDQAWFLSGAYRVLPKLELGTYNSNYRTAIVGPSQHIFDQAVTARVDLTKFWVAKVEGHFMDGYGSAYSAHGFYSSTNPNGLVAKTNLLVIRSSWYF